MALLAEAVNGLHFADVQRGLLPTYDFLQLLKLDLI